MLSMLLIGECDAGAEPADQPAEVEILRAADLDAALRLLDEPVGAAVELVVLADERGGKFSEADIAALRRRAPLARVWRMLGSWCEGEARSGRPPAGCLTTYWHQWEARLGRELARHAAGASPAWALPITATADERIAADAAAQAAPRRSGTIVVVASRASTAESLVDLCQAAGYQTVCGRPDANFRAVGARAILWDTTVDAMCRPACVAEIQRLAVGTPLVAIVGFPRREDIDAARRAGIRAVVSKPFLAGDLLWHLDRAEPAPTG